MDKNTIPFFWLITLSKNLYKINKSIVTWDLLLFNKALYTFVFLKHSKSSSQFMLEKIQIKGKIFSEKKKDVRWKNFCLIQTWQNRKNFRSNYKFNTTTVYNLWSVGFLLFLKQYSDQLLICVHSESVYIDLLTKQYYCYLLIS